MIILCRYAANQSGAQRFLTMKSQKEAMIATIINAPGGVNLQWRTRCHCIIFQHWIVSLRPKDSDADNNAIYCQLIPPKMVSFIGDDSNRRVIGPLFPSKILKQLPRALRGNKKAKAKSRRENQS